MRKVSLLLALALVASPSTAAAGERLDHRGAVGLSLGVGGEHATVALVNGGTNLDDNRLTFDLALTLGLSGDGNELYILARVLHGPDTGAAVGCAYRVYFGREEFKTFTDVGAKFDTAPYLGIGPAVDIGVMYDFTPLFGLYGQAGLSTEVGRGLRFGGGGSLGVQLRSYVLE